MAAPTKVETMPHAQFSSSDSLVTLFQKWQRSSAARVFYTAFSAVVILVGTMIAIQYAKGNFRYTQQGYVSSAGLLNANSFPTGAEVFIDDKLVTASDDTLYLEPKNYLVRIVKDGYSSWEKMLRIEPQLVTQTNAMLFPTAPSLTPLSFSGIQLLSPSPDGQKLLYFVASSSSQTNKTGLYVLDLSTSSAANIMGMQRSARQILETPATGFAEPSFIWSPDSAEVLVSTTKSDWLIPTDRKSVFTQLTDIGWKKKTILAEWEYEMYLRDRQFFAKFPAEVLQIATQSAKNVYLSPDKKRMLYTATAAAELSVGLIPPVPAANTQPETRRLEPGKLYVYDREEDKNFLIANIDQSVAASESADPILLMAEKRLLANDLDVSQPKTLTASESAFYTLQATSSAQTALNFSAYHSSLYINTLQWFPDSKHLLFVRDNKIEIMEYDGTNLTTLYSGPFTRSFTYPWPDGSRLLILTAFSPDSPLNLYAIELK